MKLEFLGTGAADYNLERDANDAGFRRFSSMMINDTLLIDPGPHIFHYAETFGKENLFENVKTVIITHSHEDHLSPESVKRLAAICPGCTFAGNAISLKELADAGVNVPYTVLTPFERYTFDDYTVVPLLANHNTHKPGEQPLLYSIEAEGKTLYYGTDTGWLPAATWDYMVTQQYDAMIFELTIGEASYDFRIFTHTSIEMLKIMLRTIRHRETKHYNATKVGCKFFSTHHARTLHPDQATLEATLAPLNVTPAFDGMIAEV